MDASAALRLVVLLFLLASIETTLALSENAVFLSLTEAVSSF